MTLTPEKLSQIQTNATNKRIREIISSVKSGALVPRPDFQRRLVWTNKDKVRFLETILKHMPFPEIYVSAGEVDTTTAEGKDWLVDGQQRVSTIVSYFSGDTSLRLGDDITPYQALDEKAKERFLEYVVVVRDLGKLSLDDVREIFQRINSTRYGLNAMELANARYDGAIKNFVQRLAELQFFTDHSVFNASDIRRMLDISFCLSLVITLQAGYFDDTKEHEAYLEKFNDDFPGEDEYRARVEQVIDFIERMNLPDDTRWWKKADLFTLMVELDDVVFRKQREVNPSKLASRLRVFEADVLAASKHDKVLQKQDDRYEVAAKYSYAASQGTNHRNSRRTRGTIIAQLIEAAAASSSRRGAKPPPRTTRGPATPKPVSKGKITLKKKPKK